MPNTAREIPPPLELACLKALWSIEEGNVRAVQQVVAQSRPLAYTTIMTVLDRLVRKGKLTRRKVGRSFVYSPAATRDTMRRVAVRELLDGFFDGSEEQLLGFLRGETGKPHLAATAADQGRIDTVLL
ncbi:MAG TPA: BlaI/MecI/CopY family transcriptional regulator [Bryobacteraceae bacterium]|nr:BlaI/MecI/CopY family transcriptional regulator [Bryobacteraceae bacterium]